MVGLRLLQRLLGLVSTVILARILFPEDFGLVALAFTLYALVEILGAFGFDMALIRDQQAERYHYNAAWSLNLAYRTVAALFLLLAAPYAARFYGDPRVGPVVSLFALITFIQGFENIGIVAFRKELTFQREFLFQFAKKIAGVSVTIALALVLRDYRALVLGTLAATVTGVVLSYRMHPFRPRPGLRGARDLWRFSGWMLGNNFAVYGRERGPDLIIGRLLDAQGVGAYRVAADIAQLPTSELYMPIMRAVFPGFSRIAHDLPRLRRGYLSAQGVVALVTLPAGMGILAIADPLVRLLLGERWVMTIPLIEALALYGVIQVLHGNRFSLFLALGRPYWVGIFLLFDILITLPLMGYLLWAGHGLAVAVWARVAASLVLLPPGVLLVSHYLEMARGRFLAVVWRPVLAAVVMAALLHLLVERLGTAASSGAAGGQLLLLVPLGGAIYLVTLLAAWFAVGRPAGAESRLLEMAADKGLLSPGLHRRLCRLSA